MAEWTNGIIGAVAGAVVAIAGMSFVDRVSTADLASVVISLKAEIARVETAGKEHHVGPPHKGVETAVAKLETKLDSIQRDVIKNGTRIGRQWDVVNDIQATLRLLQADAARKMQGADR